MRRSSGAVAALSLLVATLGANTAVGQGSSGQGSVALFDGGDLDQWVDLGDANWTVVDDVVQADSGNGFLVSAESYGDFRLTLEFWTDPDANSGIFIRCSDPNDVGAANCYEVNIYDKRPDQTYRTGGIVNFAAPTSIIDAGDRWNSYEITAQGSRLLVELNGTVTVDIEDATYTEGPFALQYGAGIVKFRNVRLQQL